jgi:DNA-directed RNA polymerase subunit RPC12/RpoP
MAIEFTTLYVCIDCMQFVAGTSAEERGEEYPTDVTESFERDSNLWFFNGDTDDTIDFATFQCEQCGTRLAGERLVIIYCEKP